MLSRRQDASTRGNNNAKQITDAELVPVNVKSFFAGKTLLITGSTGFVGKVYVEKLLRAIPEVKKVFLLIRPRPEKHSALRLQKEIIESPIFKKMRDNMGSDNFEKMARAKLIAVAGDTASEDLFIEEKAATTTTTTTTTSSNNGDLTSKELIASLRHEVQIVIHIAATIGFMERLDKAIQLNTFGTLRMLSFAKTCDNIQAFCHISTCYANANSPSYTTIQEKQYDHPFPNNESMEQFCNRITHMNPEQVEAMTPSILAHFKYPNTYTFTKWMAEHLVVKNHEHVPVAIVRPSVIGSACKEPFPGWIDGVSAGSAVFFFCGLGVSKLMPGDQNLIADNVPVDYVANAIFVCTATVATDNLRNMEKEAIVRTFHCGTSDKHPVTWETAKNGMVRYWQSHKLKKSFAPASMTIVKNNLLFQLRFLIQYTFFTKFYAGLSKITNRKEHVKIAKGLAYMEKKSKYLVDNFKPFTTNQWIFYTPNMQEAFSRVLKDQQRTFFLDFTEIDWSTYFHYNCWGLHKYVFKENPAPPTQSDITRQNAIDWFSDITFAYAATSDFNNRRSRQELMNTVFSSTRVQNAIKLEMSKGNNLATEFVEQRARDIMDKMFADPQLKVLRVLGWSFRKIWRRMYQSIVVDDSQVEKVRQLLDDQKTNGPLIIIPTHRSYVDFLILSYMFFAYNIPVPHIAAGEDFLNMFIVKDLFRNSGAFFIRRSFGEDELYKAIFAEYVQQLLLDGSSIEFFVEGTRSRGGKTLQPKMGLLSIIADAFLDKKVSNLTILPVHISYEKVLESEAYSGELLGEQKTRESLQNLIKARNVLYNKYGTIYVKFGKPVGVKKYLDELVERSKYGGLGKALNPYQNNDDKKQFVRYLAYQVAHELNQAATIMPSAMVATIVLFYRHGISLDELANKMQWLKKEIEKRGGKVYWGTGDIHESTSAIIEHALQLLEKQIIKRKHMLEPAIQEGKRKDYRALIHLNTYRNQLVHLFVQEGIVCCALENLYQDQTKGEEGIDRQAVVKECQFLGKLLEREFVYRPNPDIPEDFEKVIDVMMNKGLVSSVKGSNNQKLLKSTSASESHHFLCAMFWPFIDGYWATIMSMFSMQLMYQQSAETLAHVTTPEEREMKGVRESSLYERVQWFGDKMFADSKILFYEALSIETVKNAIETFISWHVLKRTYKEVKTVKLGKETKSRVAFIHLEAPYTSAEELSKLADRIGNFRKNPSSTHIVSDQPFVNLVEDIPVMSKL